MKYVAPERGAQACTCPFCGVLAKRENYSSQYLSLGGNTAYSGTDWLSTSICEHCSEAIIWRNAEMIFPRASSAPTPNEDMPADVKADYLEASSISTASPKASAALLRLAIQKLCIHLGGEGKNINEDIGTLVKKGMSPKIQQALDIVRVVGNNAVHPGQISVDKAEDVAQLFTLVNLIVEAMISTPKKIQSMYDALPSGAREAIAKRDAPK